MKKIKEKMLKLGYVPKREFSIVIFITLFCVGLGIGTYLSFGSLMYLLYGIGVGFIFSIVFLSRYGKQLDVQNAKNLEEFVVLFGYFKIYIHNGFSVYTSLKELTTFASPSLKDLLENLISEIDDDKTVRPFIRFAKTFNEIIVEEMMISIFQMVDDGEQSDYLLQFELIFDKFSEMLYQKSLRNKDSKLGTLSTAPLIGSCFLVVVLTIGIIGIIGEMINGL